jgi:hypothetical protein
MTQKDFHDSLGNPIVQWPKHYKPLPEGYIVVQLDSGHYVWSYKDEFEGRISGDKYWVRRCVFAHHAKMQEEGLKNA